MRAQPAFCDSVRFASLSSRHAVEQSCGIRIAWPYQFYSCVSHAISCPRRDVSLTVFHRPGVPHGQPAFLRRAVSLCVPE